MRQLPRVLLTGGTGYVGGRLLSRLEAEGRSVRCLARHPENLRARVAASTEVVGGDLTEPESLRGAFDGCEVAYFLVHSMGDGDDFEALERAAAQNFAEEAKRSGIRHILYLGGLGHGDELSRHLQTRQEVGRILRESGIPTTEFRASIIIGSGSLSFEMVRALVEKLPVMITPRWVSVPAQPISIEDVLDYLVEAGTRRPGESRVYEIGGEDVVSYREIMAEYARQRGLSRRMIQVPVLTPKLSSLWLGLVTPIYARVGRKLLEGVRNETTVRDPSALEAFAIRPRGIRESIERALRAEDREIAETRWSDALSSGGPLPRHESRTYGSRIVDSRVLPVAVDRACAFAPVRRIGGRAGWYFGDWLWTVRGLLDLLVGGPGMRRGRRDPERLAPGDTLDFWRVEAVEPDRLLRLFAEMRLPGRAWLQFEIEDAAEGSRIRQTAIFDPHGLLGLLYWYALSPIHHLMFGRMLHRIGRRATLEHELVHGDGATAAARPSRTPRGPRAAGAPRPPRQAAIPGERPA